MGAAINSASGTNATVLFNGYCKVTGWTFHNGATGGARVVKLYDMSRKPIVGTDVPLVKISVPYAATSNQGANFSSASFNNGVPFYNGLAYAITTGIANNDAGAVAADDVTGVLDWTVRTD